MFLTFILLSFFSKLVCAQNDENSRSTYLWSISDDKKGLRGFLFGTIHVPYTDVWDSVSERVKEAFALSDSVLLELNLHDDETLIKLAKCKNLPKKQTARSYLPSSLFKRIESIMKTYDTKKKRENRMPSGKKTRSKNNSINWQRKRPEWLLFILQHLFINYWQNKAPILDIYLAQSAIENDKIVGSIETVEEQCRPVSSLSVDDIIFAITHTVMFLEHLKVNKNSYSAMHEDLMHSLIDNYKRGKFDQKTVFSDQLTFPGINLTSEECERANNINAAIKSDIIVRRNAVLAERIHDYFMRRRDSVFFAAIGLGHFFGESSITHALRAKGYLIQPINVDYKIGVRTIERVKSMWRKETNFPRSLTMKSITFGMIPSAIYLAVFI